MKQSASIQKLAAALAAAQAEMPPIPLDSTNMFLGNRFASLGSVIRTIQPVLAKHELAVVQLPFSEEGAVGITTMLLHSSGEWIQLSIALPLPKEKGKSIAQVAGGVISYLRRYSLAAALNLYTEEDTDGASRPGPRPRPRAKARPDPVVAVAKELGAEVRTDSGNSDDGIVAGPVWAKVFEWARQYDLDSKAVRAILQQAYGTTAGLTKKQVVQAIKAAVAGE